MGTGEEREIEELLHQNFPDLVITTLRKLGEGWRSCAYLINGEMVFRIPKDEEGTRDTEKEMRILPLLKDSLSLRIPEILYWGKQENGYPFMGYPLVPGEPLDERYFSSLPQEVQAGIAEQLAQFIGQVRSFPTERARNLSVPERNFFRYYTTVYQNLQELLFPQIKRELATYLVQCFDWYLGEARHFQYVPALLHGDLSCEHLLFDRAAQQLSGIIDFGDLLIGDPIFEYRYFVEECGWEFTGVVMDLVGEGASGIKERIGFFLTADAAEYALEGLNRGDVDMLLEGISLLDEARLGSVLY